MTTFETIDRTTLTRRAAANEIEEFLASDRERMNHTFEDRAELVAFQLGQIAGKIVSPCATFTFGDAQIVESVAEEHEDHNLGEVAEWMFAQDPAVAS